MRVLRVYSFLALGLKDSALATVEKPTDNPTVPRCRMLADSLKS